MANPTTRLAAFDFGSNSIKCLVVEVGEPGFSGIGDIRAQNRLAEYLDAQKNLSAQAISNSTKLLNPIMEYCRSQQVQHYLAVGTQALRQASNAMKFISQVKAVTGLDIRIISPREEAELACLGVLSGMENPLQELWILDSGGASTEAIHTKEGKILESVSLPLGAVALTKSCIHSDPISRSEQQDLVECINNSLQRYFTTTPEPQPSLSVQTGKVIGIGGGIVACAKVALLESLEANPEITQPGTSMPPNVDGFSLTRQELSRQTNLYYRLNIDQRKQIPGMEPERADIITASATLYYTILKHIQSDAIQVSTRGLRHGLIQRYFSPNS